MRRKILIMSIALICLMVSVLSAQKNHYRKADHALRAVYEEITGVSLEEAIDQLIAEKREGRMADGNVIVRFNGGGTRNKLYIGRENTLEFLVENDYNIQAASLGFEFSCTGGPGSFSWVHGYGTHPAGDPVLQTHFEPFVFYPWGTQVDVSKEPDTILFGGAGYNYSQTIDIHTTPVVL
ncbi:MAG: hypothetical protein GWO41_06215, partial [candidate division Zixibacteria bacterium]|nr:hypothetical protein [candidate division Zixibacteria bacterium]NIR62782.1 hypothetical protein [candidate division Zixibacteria bacterium]NIS15885.1 hypothetical protein [candidate division Zixibacteria bacterium]NIS44852.1 hypothetical protein [candidate division Zixibacteria bacterium]NIT52334.1 hypothetical protein [candidate division Zixibacteria bacterium]